MFDNDYQDLDTLDRSSTDYENDALKDLPNDINDEVLDLKIGLVFPTLETSTKYISKLLYNTLCPLVKTRSQKSMITDKGIRIRGCQCFSCPHGIKRKGTGSNQRPCQRVKYTGCQVHVTVNEQMKDAGQ